MVKRSPRLPQGPPQGKKGTLMYPKPKDAPRKATSSKVGHFTGKVRLKGEALEALRRQIFVEAVGKCQKCGVFAGWYFGHMHHKVHRSLGGSDSLENCIWLCPKCHGGEHAGSR